MLLRAVLAAGFETGQARLRRLSDRKTLNPTGRAASRTYACSGSRKKNSSLESLQLSSLDLLRPTREERWPDRRERTARLAQMRNAR